MANENPEGWPLTDPYPFRDKDYSAEIPDCDFVVRDKEYAKTANVEEIGDYPYIMKSVWKYINELYQEVQDLKDHIKWLKNTGGEHLNFACGVDIFCRDLAIKNKRKRSNNAATKKTEC